MTRNSSTVILFLSGMRRNMCLSVWTSEHFSGLGMTPACTCALVDSLLRAVLLPTISHDAQTNFVLTPQRRRNHGIKPQLSTSSILVNYTNSALPNVSEGARVHCVDRERSSCRAMIKRHGAKHTLFHPLLDNNNLNLHVSLLIWDQLSVKTCFLLSVQLLDLPRTPSRVLERRVSSWHISHF